MAGWGRTGVFILVDSQRNLITHPRPHTLLRSWRKMLLQRELIQNPVQLAFSCGYLHTNESFNDTINNELTDIVTQWFKLIGAVLTQSTTPSYENIVNVLKNDEG